MDYPHRKRTRLTDYDYSTPGAYFVTICTHEKKCLFGKIASVPNFGEPYMQYSPVGEIAKQCLLEITSHFPGIMIDNWVIMPNHIHILFRIAGSAARIYPRPTANISTAVGTFKAAVTRAVGNAYMRSGKVWQASFHDHIVRTDEDYQNFWQYISGNPGKWLEDCFYCKNC